MRKEEVIALKQAILMEIEGYEFYRMAQSQFDNPEVKKAFGQLMEEEKMHVKWLEEAHEKLNHDDNRQEVLSFLETTPTQKIFNWENLMQKSAQSPLAVFGIALDLEKSSIDHYKKQADATDIEDLKKLFTILATWEKNHHDQFSKLYNQLKEEWWSEQNYAPHSRLTFIPSIKVMNPKKASCVMQLAF